MFYPPWGASPLVAGLIGCRSTLWKWNAWALCSSMLVFVEHEPILSSFSTLTAYTPTMTSQWQMLVIVVLSLILNALAITRYIPEGQETLFGIQPSSTDTSLTASYTGSAAYDPRTLTPPSPPTDPPVNTQFAIQLVGDPSGLSIPHHSAFLGFSIELSVSNHVRKCSLYPLAYQRVRSSVTDASGPQRVWLSPNLWFISLMPHCSQLSVIRSVLKPIGEFTTAFWQNHDSRRRQLSGDRHHGAILA